QAALNVVGAQGGTVYLPAGLYVVGVPNATTNRPLFVGSNTRVTGDGKGATVLKVCNEANQRQPADPTNVSAGIFANKANTWYLPQGGTPLPPDLDITIEDLTLDGNRNNQSQIIFKGNTTNGVNDPWPPGVTL